MIRPKLTKDEALAMIIKSGYKIPESIYVLSIRGYYRDSMGKKGVNDIGLYDDAMFLIGPDLFLSFNANTDPSKQTPGIATLNPGLHYFKKGNHGISKPGGGYPAFRPATPDESLPVMRQGKVGLSKGIAINIHKGGYTYTSSAGCQTLYPDQWMEFQKTTYTALQRAGQRLLPYLLIDNK